MSARKVLCERRLRGTFKKGNPSEKENFQLEPDIRATLPYDALINGKDTQIEAAVKEMLRVIGEGNK